MGIEFEKHCRQILSINQKKNLQWLKWQQTLQGRLRSHTWESSGKEKQNRWSLRCCLNTVNDEAEVTSVVACSRCGLRLPEKRKSRWWRSVGQPERSAT